MAFQVYRAAPRPSMVQNCGIIASKQLTKVCVAVDYYPTVVINMKRKLEKQRRLQRSMDFRVTASLDASLVGQVTEVTKDTFWPIVKAAGEKTVVLDMYTQWCGPCKVIAPKYKELSEKYEDVLFLKLDCNQENKPLAKELGIKVVPTFKIIKDGNIVKEVTGAKFDDLVAAIEAARST